MKVRRIHCCILCGVLSLLSCDLLSDLGERDARLTEGEIIAGLKEALIVGSKTAAFTLSDTSGTTNVLGEVTGYLANELLRIALPDDAEQAISTVQKLGSTAAGRTLLAAAGVDLASYRDAMVRGLNRGAEHAAGLSVDVFTEAITQMTFASARNILFGEDSLGATQYLQQTTTDVLTAGFEPIIDRSFGSVMVSALGSRYTVKGLWQEFALNYNKVAGAYAALTSASTSSDLVAAAAARLTLNAIQSAGVSSVDSLSTDIVDYATEKALVGLFYMVGRQEIKLRSDVAEALRTAADFVTEHARDLIEKVFTEKE